MSVTNCRDTDDGYGSRRNAATNAATYGYVLSGRVRGDLTGIPTGREQTIERLEKLVIPSLESLGKDGKVRAGGITLGTLSRTFVVEAKSKDEVSEPLRALPAQGIMSWKVTEIEPFVHRTEIERKVLQGLRTQK